MSNSDETRYRYQYTAVMPERAWARGGQPPRERARKRQARDDLIAGLDRYINSGMPLQTVRGSAATAEQIAVQWIVWAAQLGAGRHALAPDCSQWWIRIRWEPTW